MKKVIVALSLISSIAFAQVSPVGQGQPIEAAKMNELITKINELNDLLASSESKKIGTLVKISNSEVQLSGLSILRLGSEFKTLTNPTLSTSVTGIGGMDSGVSTASNFYYVYAVSNSSNSGLVASLNKTSPSGYANYKKVGAFYTNSSNQIFRAYANNESNETVYAIYVTSNNLQQQSPVFINSLSSSAGFYNGGFQANHFSVQPIATPGPVDGLGGGADVVCRVTSITVSGFQLYTGIQNSSQDDGGVAGQDRGCSVSFRKVGVDSIKPDWKDY